MHERILITGTSVRRELLKPLMDSGYIIENPTHLLSDSELKHKLESSSAYLLGGDEIATRSALSTAKNLKLIAFLGMGYESYIDVKAAKELGIPITNTPGTLSNSVAEYTVGLVLSSTRKIHLYSNHFETGRTGDEEKQHDLASMDVGIIGLGGIGIRVAEILRGGYDCRVSYYSRTRKMEEERRLGVSFKGSLSELIQNSDVIILLTPLTPDTKRMIRESEISQMRDGVIIVNSARPEIIDGIALLSALQSGKIGYAAFDGFYDSPTDLVNRLKRQIPDNLMVTGHIASLTHEARDGMAIKAVRSILNVLQSGTDTNIVT